MERTGHVQTWAGVAMLALCLLIGAVEGFAVFRAASAAYSALWLVGLTVFLGGSVVAAWQASPALTTARRVALAAGPVLGATLVVYLSATRGGLSYILLVVSASIAAILLRLPAVIAVIVFNSTVVAVSVAGLGPSGGGGLSAAEVVLNVALYTMLQSVVVATVWAQARVEDALEQLSVAHVELRGTSVLLAESSRERERLRISRELHDVLGHQLSVLAVQLEVATHHAEGEAREQVLRSRELARRLLEDVRSVVSVERGRGFDLPAALARVVEEVPRPRVHLDVEADLCVDDDRAATLVRAVQEIATNTIRHSAAENLWLTLADGGDAVVLTAQDDGVGGVPVVPGNGLAGLQERVQQHGGSLDVYPGHGVRVEIILPSTEAASP